MPSPRLKAEACPDRLRAQCCASPEFLLGGAEAVVLETEPDCRAGLDAAGATEMKSFLPEMLRTAPIGGQTRLGISDLSTQRQFVSEISPSSTGSQAQVVLHQARCRTKCAVLSTDRERPRVGRGVVSGRHHNRVTATTKWH